VGRAIGADVRGGQWVIAARRFVDFWNGAGTFDALPPPRREAIAMRMTAVAAQFAALWQDPGAPGALRALAMPVQLYYGTRTLDATRRIVELLAAALPDARVQRMTAMGHMGPITHPHSFAQALAAFVELQVGRDHVAPLARAA
jgi:pimeloyl-ACP methyl ester carboxylesterase